METVRRRACAYGVALLCLSSALGGQTPPPEPAEENASDLPEAAYSEEITVKETPTLTVPSPEARSQELEEVPGGTNLIDAEEVARGRASTLKDALDFAPGVFVQPRYGSEESRLSIRGSGLQRTFHGRGLKLLQDGVPLNLADGGFDFQAVEPLVSRYVEVFRGANGLEYGSSTLGGAVNYVSRNGYDASRAQARFETGAFGYLRGQASSGGVAGPVDYYASLSHFGQDGFRDHSEQSTQRFFGNLGYRLRDDRETRFYLTAVRTDSELPGNLTKAQLENNPSQAAAGNLALDQKRDFDLLRLANRTSFVLSEESRVDVGTFWSYKSLDHPIFQVLDQVSNDFGVDVRYERQAPLGGRRHRLTVGLAPSFGMLDDNRFRNVAGQRGERTAQGRTESTNLDLYAEDRIEIGSRLAVIAGAQASWAGRDFSDEFLRDGDQTDSQSFTGVSPKLGMLWDVSPDVAVFGNVSRVFEPPSFGELTNVGGDGLLPLDAQTGTSVDLGTRGTAGFASWDVVLYQAWLNDELLSQNDGVGNPLGTVNAGRTTHAGVEAGFNLRFRAPGGNLVLRQVYNWSRFRFDGDPVYGDNQLAGLPEHFYRADFLYEREAGFYGGPNVEWVPEKYPVDHANTLFADPYTLVGFKVGYRAESGWAGFVEGKNLTDEIYAATTGVLADARGRDSAQFLPGDGRSVFAGLEYRW
ncbi:MAG TPA: TonB-dependent receptor [Thermoanaerobaculia bacterium]|nr:TonB-dependent receptor [Thermoanaerobaculia bacterium]